MLCIYILSAMHLLICKKKKYFAAYDCILSKELKKIYRLTSEKQPQYKLYCFSFLRVIYSSYVNNFSFCYECFK